MLLPTRLLQGPTRLAVGLEVGVLYQSLLPFAAIADRIRPRDARCVPVVPPYRADGRELGYFPCTTAPRKKFITSPSSRRDADAGAFPQDGFLLELLAIRLDNRLHRL